MELLPVLQEGVDYNYWARDRQLEACAALSQEQLLRRLGGSFASLRDTLVHLMAVEWIWLERWRGRSPLALEPAEDFPTLATLSQRWRDVEGQLRGFMAGLTEPALAAPLTITSTRGEPWTYPLWRMVQHLLNHQSYHRGQVTHQLRLLGLEPPRIDFLVAHDQGLGAR